ncbi:hypothetical protein VTN96DRAFT_9214 [Rasamsonia emersonii]
MPICTVDGSSRIPCFLTDSKRGGSLVSHVTPSVLSQRARASVDLIEPSFCRPSGDSCCHPPAPARRASRKRAKRPDLCSAVLDAVKACRQRCLSLPCPESYYLPDSPKAAHLSSSVFGAVFAAYRLRRPSQRARLDLTLPESIGHCSGKRPFPSSVSSRTSLLSHVLSDPSRSPAARLCPAWLSLRPPLFCGQARSAGINNVTPPHPDCGILLIPGLLLLRFVLDVHHSALSTAVSLSETPRLTPPSLSRSTVTRRPLSLDLANLPGSF